MQGFLITLHFVDTLNYQDNFYEIKSSILHIAYMLFVLAGRNGVKIEYRWALFFQKVLEYLIWSSDLINFSLC
jgi:hypothetical protein